MRRTRADRAFAFAQYSAVEIGRTLSPLPLAWSNTLRAMSAQLLTAPEPVRSYVPNGAPESSRWKIASAMSRVKVRRPYWSSTTVTSSRPSRESATRSGQGHHGLDEVASLADHPAGTQDVMARRVRHGDVARGLGLPVHAERRERLLLVMLLGGAVEHVVRAHVHQGDVVLVGDPGEQGLCALAFHATGRPSGVSALSTAVSLGVHDRAVQAPVEPVVLGRVGEVERVDVVELEALQAVLLHVVADGVAELAVAAGDHRAARAMGGAP